MSMIVGVDLGKANDPTAIVAIESCRPEPKAPREWPDPRFRIRWIERVPLGTDYAKVIDRIGVVADAAAGWGPSMIVIDATGLGQVVRDMLRRRTSVPLRAVTFTSSGGVTMTSAIDWSVPKYDLVTSLEVILQSRRLECVPDCPHQADLAAELSTFRFEISARGYTSFEAASGSHDDLVSALMLACWLGSRPSPGEAWIEATKNRTAQLSERS